MVFWWANADWAQQADPTFAYADGVYSITAPYATAAQWQAQCSIHNGGVDLKAGQAYDISVTLVASEGLRECYGQGLSGRQRRQHTTLCQSRESE